MTQERPRLRVRRVTLAVDRVLYALDVRLRRLPFEEGPAPEFVAHPYVPRLQGEGYGWTVTFLWRGCSPSVTILQREGHGELVVIPRYEGWNVHGHISMADKDHSVAFSADAYGRAADVALDTLKRLYHREAQLTEKGAPV